jgi:hypothetical protein
MLTFLSHPLFLHCFRDAEIMRAKQAAKEAAKAAGGGAAAAPTKK